MVTIHTLVSVRSDPNWYLECLSSIPYGVDHAVIAPGSDFRGGRWDGLHLDQFVGALDDDDRMVGNPVELCMKALKETGAGIAFTYEARIDGSGNLIKVDRPNLTTMDVAMHPGSLHHFALMRRECISDGLYEMSLKFHAGSIDWLTKSWVALKHGAVQVPVVGYEWRNHDSCMSQSADEIIGFCKHLDSIRQLTRSWLTKHRKIPKWTMPQISQS